MHAMTAHSLTAHREGRRGAPVVVLTYAESGSELLRSALDTHPDLCWTTSIGLLPLCRQALRTWQLADECEGISSLAATSIRIFVSSVITSILARSGKKRWCEIATAPIDCAETFLSLYPRTQFLCLHRQCADVIYSGLRTNPWGLGDSIFWPFAQRFPGSGVAAIAAYWAAHAGPLLEFEAAHPAVCHRIRYEDLVTEPGLAMSEIQAFLDLKMADCQAPNWASEVLQGHLDCGSTLQQSRTSGTPHNETTVPFHTLAPPLLAQINKLLATLGYPSLT